MISQTVNISNKLGLHARAASVFVKLACSFSSDILVTRAHKKANGKSIMALMMLEAAKGNDLILSIDGPDEKAAMSGLIKLIEDRFGESE